MVDDDDDDNNDGWVFYKLTYEPLAQVSLNRPFDDTELNRRS